MDLPLGKIVQSSNIVVQFRIETAEAAATFLCRPTFQRFPNSFGIFCSNILDHIKINRQLSIEEEREVERKPQGETFSNEIIIKEERKKEKKNQGVRQERRRERHRDGKRRGKQKCNELHALAYIFTRQKKKNNRTEWLGGSGRCVSSYNSNPTLVRV